MTTTPTPATSRFSRVALGATMLGLLATGCDAEAGATSDYRVVVHADVGALKASPWIADTLARDKIDLPAEFAACEPLVLGATAVTVGANEATFEAYVEGKFSAKQATACADHITAAVAKKSTSADERVDVVQLGEGVLAVYRGPFKPSRARLTSLKAADPTPAGKHPLWLVAHDDADKGEVEHVEAWMTAGKGLDAHATVHFDSAKAATEIYAQAMLGLTALRFSDDMGELAKAISLSSGGDTLTAEFHASSDLISKLMAASRVKAKVAPRTDDDGEDDQSAGFSIEID